MSVLPLLIAISVSLGLVALGAFFWALRTGQFDDPEGDACRILDEEDVPKEPHGEP